MATVFDVVAEPTRRRILDLLLEQPRSVGELVGALGLTQPGTSKHLRVLREAGLVRVRVDAQRRWYELRPEPLVEVESWLAPYRRLWERRLDALERHLDAMPDEAAGTRPGATDKTDETDETETDDPGEDRP
ncbi:MAG TPA: metalloregulator ArsR/SmtB family transcription factor [Acidimicrobiales bacterium]